METRTDWFTENPETVFKSVYAANYPWLEHYILHNSGTTEDAKDIFQESLCACWINVKEGRFTGSPEQFNAYLRQICKYKWLNQLKSSSHKNIQYRNEWGEQEPTDQGPQQLEQQLEQSSLLQQSFGQLGEKCKEILGLFYYKRQSLTEIAAKMNNTEESIKTIKYRCMMQLRKHFLEQNSSHNA